MLLSIAFASLLVMLYVITILVAGKKCAYLIILLFHHAGTKIIFWDLREPFIENLYKPNVSRSRLEALIEPLDMVRFPNMCYQGSSELTISV